jgi:hypothetical protein
MLPLAYRFRREEEEGHYQAIDTIKVCVESVRRGGRADESAGGRCRAEFGESLESAQIRQDRGGIPWENLRHGNGRGPYLELAREMSCHRRRQRRRERRHPSPPEDDAQRTNGSVPLPI